MFKNSQKHLICYHGMLVCFLQGLIQHFCMGGAMKRQKARKDVNEEIKVLSERRKFERKKRNEWNMVEYKHQQKHRLNIMQTRSRITRVNVIRQNAVKRQNNLSCEHIFSCLI
ncbi:CLUMA_CG019833, isoform A [Clunio marinus]|uniref:CLUMA_CG019833, isoform A n=1 Tax=Clunio marinus TaxID=568069 RepID=A0A1J1J769_9DIPT|nr:CLUMA_CG019833, isoform A [Clunio marinus]